jgi:hypothetical protein
MRYVRLVHPKNFDRRTGRFKDLAFTLSSSGGGASIIGKECSVSTSGSLCEHIDTFYPKTGGDPAVYWAFDSSRLEPGCDVIQTDSSSGDKCHYEIVAKSRSAAKKMLRNWVNEWQLSNLRICDQTGVRPLEIGDCLKYSDV